MFSLEIGNTFWERPRRGRHADLQVLRQGCVDENHQNDTDNRRYREPSQIRPRTGRPGGPSQAFRHPRPDGAGLAGQDREVHAVRIFVGMLGHITHAAGSLILPWLYTGMLLRLDEVCP